MHIELIALITDIYFLLRPKCDIPFNTLLQLNSMTSSKIQVIYLKFFKNMILSISTIFILIYYNYYYY